MAVASLLRCTRSSSFAALALRYRSAMIYSFSSGVSLKSIVAVLRSMIAVVGVSLRAGDFVEGREG